MFKTFKNSLVLLLPFFVLSCGVAHRLPTQQTGEAASTGEEADLPTAMHASSYNQIQATLRRAYREWKGTPYEWGGELSSGVDCSAFMQIVFNRYFGVELPRVTSQQIYEGTEVSRKNLKPGDLVFFKTGRNTLHVGVLLEGHKFIHASTSQGVTISSLKNYYWRSRFLTAKRVLK